MNLQKYFLVFLLCLIPLSLSAQRTISGRITDADDGAPIPGAAVFIANTTVGTTTDTTGSYQLKIPGEGSYQLAVSHVGYLPVFMDIESGKTSKSIDVTLQIREMEEVEVTVKAKVRNKDKDLFWEKVLGTKPSKKTIWVSNPADVYYFYNAETKKLTVTCRAPLQIVNHKTGYHIQYVLNYFTHDYKTKLTSWEGQYMFTELEPENFRQQQLWEKNRKNVYQVCMANFIKSLYQDVLWENGFLLTTRIIKQEGVSIYYLANLNDILTTGTIENSKTLRMSNELILFCYGKPIDGRAELYKINKKSQSINSATSRRSGSTLFSQDFFFQNKLQAADLPVHIFPDGTYKNPLLFSPGSTSPKMLSGLDMMLPTEYILAADPRATSADTINEDDEVTPGIQLPVHPLVAPLLDVAKHFDMQLSVFPQEKVYLHTDKPYYISGERIWFRAHVVDAASHTPAPSTYCVYADLFDPADSLVCRVRTGLEYSGNDTGDSAVYRVKNMFSGYIDIPEDVPEGDYTIRAYTGAMRNLDEDYFFIKNICIGDPMTRIIQADSEFEFLSDKRINADIRFTNTHSLSPITPESVKIGINSGHDEEMRRITGRNGIFGVNFNLSPVEKERVMLLEAQYDKKPYRKYIKIPLPEDDFDVSFYPEGGYLLTGCKGRVAFKAMQRDGTDMDISGIVYDRQGNELVTFKTDLFGMGFFDMEHEPNEMYYAVCTNNNGQSKRFDLPVAKNEGYALSTAWYKENLIVKTLYSEHQKNNDTLFLIVHTRGIVQNVRIWENINEPIVFRKDFFPSGITNLLLLTKQMLPVSERLVFVNHDDQANVVCATDKDKYSIRSPVEYTVNIIDELQEPVRGNFSVSVTDDHDVAVDTVFNILTSLLLTSDLRGHISNPAFYLQKNNRQAEYALDLLMLTQGWRRYDTERIVRNDLMYPDTLLGQGYEIAGTVDYRYLNLTGAELKANVSMLTNQAVFLGNTVTDSKGRFYLHDGGAPDSTVFFVQAEIQSGKKKLELTLDKATYPARKIPVVRSDPPNLNIFAKYADKAEQKYVDENGIRMIYLSEVIITASKKSQHRSFFSSLADYSITEDEIDKRPPVSMNALLSRLPDVTVKATKVIINRYDCPATFLVDDLQFNYDEIDWIEVSDVAQVELIRDPYALSFLGVNAPCGVISIITKRGIPFPRRETSYIKHIMPLGFQKPAAFYAPKYDTPALNTKPDLRTTIHWEPNLTTDEEGNATFSFYTADTPSTYTVVIEGVTEDGKIVYKRDRIVVGGK